MRNITYQIHNEEEREGDLGNLAEFYSPNGKGIFVAKIKKTFISFQFSLQEQNLKRQMINTKIKNHMSIRYIVTFKIRLTPANKNIVD